jgi:hypothetical protein
MLETVLLNAVSLSTPGTAYSATKTTLQAGTAALQVHLKLTAGSAENKNSRSKVICFVAVSPFDVSAALAPNIFRLQAATVEVPSHSDQGVIGNATEVLPALGGFCYTWFEIPNFVPTVPTLSASLIELN